jgi:hypothetical protein
VSCDNYGKATARDVEYVYPGGCFVKVNGVFFTKDEYSYIVKTMTDGIVKKNEECN